MKAFTEIKERFEKRVTSCLKAEAAETFGSLNDWFTARGGNIYLITKLSTQETSF